MPKKFDTNPLDPEFPERAKQEQAAATARQKYDAETTKFPTYADEEEEIPTRTFRKEDFKNYSSAFNESQPITPYKTARLKTQSDNTRKVDKIGLPENVLVALPYVPYIGLVAGILELVFVPKSEAKVRFHAAQGLAAHIGIWIVTTILGIVDNVTSLADIGNIIFQIVTTVMLFIFAYKAWKGEPVHIESVDGLTEWLEDKIKPQK